jgi:hypothetical protein
VPAHSDAGTVLLKTLLSYPWELLAVTAPTAAMEKTKKTKSRSGCKMCKQKRLKCDEAKPFCNQCVRRGRTCPGYRREIRWSTIISSVHGKTRPPPDDTHQDEPTGVSLSRTDSGTTASSQHDVAASNIDPQLGTDATDWNAILNSDFWPQSTCQGQGWTSVEVDSTQALGPGIEWTDWTEGADLSTPTADDMGPVEAIENMHTSLTTLPASFADVSTTQTQLSTLVPSRKVDDLGFPRPNPVDLSTTLVEYWFSHVCSMWSTYDSPQNWYRTLARDSWGYSEPVYYALQAMSASVLVDSLPHLKRTLPALTTQAAQSIHRAVQANLALQGEQARSLPTDVLLAVMGMGTSICWADPRQLGFWFLDQARGLLKRYGDEGDVILDANGQQTVEHFRQALTYWEMLANVVTKDYQSSLKAKRSTFKRRIRRAMSMNEAGADTDGIGAAVPSAGRFPKSIGKSPPMHPWGGVSSEIQQVFGLVMGLCQNRCVARISDTIPSTDDLCDALCDIELAHDLEKEILGFDFVGDANVPSNETGDPNAPLSHLVDTAEAYRLASLLHLYLAFSDLEVKFVRNCASISAKDNNKSSWVQAPQGMPRGHALVTLTLRLVEVLKRIPVDSGARCIQPILLISAATGLRFDVPAHQTNFPMGASSPIHRRGTMINQTAMFGTNTLFNSNDRAFDFSADFGSTQADADAVQLTSLTLEVAAARRFVVNRLGALQQSLPPRPIGVALALVRAVWFNYDSADENLRSMHWMNTMVNSGLQTLFG